MTPERPRRPGKGGGGGTSRGLVSQGESTAPANIVSLRSVALDRAEARARAAVDALAGQAMAALDDVLAGDIDMVWTAHMLINRAMILTDTHRLRTTA